MLIFGLSQQAILKRWQPWCTPDHVNDTRKTIRHTSNKDAFNLGYLAHTSSGFCHGLYFSSAAYSENIGRQLDLAQSWNRFDIITNEFFINMIENVQWDVSIVF